MINREAFKRIFGVGPIGTLFSIIVWMAALAIEKAVNILPMSIHPVLRMGLIIMFAIDALYLWIGSNYQLCKHGRGNILVTKGPYQYIRHPIYSIFIYSLTGILSTVFRSWTLIISVIPINLFWSWIVTFEESEMLKKFGAKYQELIENTGQFLPSWKAMKGNIEENN